jgi:hypothetical protein
MVKRLPSLLTSIIFSLCFANCSSDDKADSRRNESDSSHVEKPTFDSTESLVDWVRRNENEIEISLRKSIAVSDSLSPNDLYIEKTIVVTEYDPSILGELAKKVKSIDSALDVNYTVTSGFKEKPVIQPKADRSDGYVDLNWKGQKRIKLDKLVFEYSDTARFETKKRWK